MNLKKQTINNEKYKTVAVNAFIGTYSIDSM